MSAIPIDDAGIPIPALINAQVILPGSAETQKGQRRINLIWESTQALIAVGITGATIFAALRGISAENLNSAFVLIVAIYFVRTNHTKTGGVGADHR